MDIVSAAKRENILGEGPLWNSAEERLYWLDIGQQKMEWLCPATQKAGMWSLSVRATAIAQRKKGGLLLATDRGLAVFDTATGKVEIVLHTEPERPENRSNDGHADARGRFWVGTMHDPEQTRSGAVYRIDPDWSYTRVLDGLGIPNTLICTPDCTRLYLADSKDQALYLYDMEPETGELGPRQLFASTKDTAGTPDGSALDIDGYLWNAQWGGWRVVRYTPYGDIDRIISLPVEQPTSCVFGGEDLSVLYITTARKNLSAAALAQQPLAGHVLAFRTDVPGLPAPKFGG